MGAQVIVECITRKSECTHELIEGLTYLEHLFPLSLNPWLSHEEKMWQWGYKWPVKKETLTSLWQSQIQNKVLCNVHRSVLLQRHLGNYIGQWVYHRSDSQNQLSGTGTADSQWCWMEKNKNLQKTEILRMLLLTLHTLSQRKRRTGGVH